MDWRHSHSEYLCLTKTRVDIRTQAKKEEPTLESKARMQGGPVEIQLGSENRSFRDDYCYPSPSEAYTRNATGTYASRELMSAYVVLLMMLLRCV